MEPALETCALITTFSSACVAPIHNRMPVILPKQSSASWLDTGLNNLVYLSGLLESCQAEEMEAIPISAFVRILAMKIFAAFSLLNKKRRNTSAFVLLV